VRILQITSQIRRDFSAILICEGCGSQQVLGSGYDDRYYHDNVIPNIKCKVCGKSRNTLGIKLSPTPTKYFEFDVV